MEETLSGSNLNLAVKLIWYETLLYKIPSLADAKDRQKIT